MCIGSHDITRTHIGDLGDLNSSRSLPTFDAQGLKEGTGNKGHGTLRIPGTKDDNIDNGGARGSGGPARGASGSSGQARDTGTSDEGGASDQKGKGKWLRESSPLPPRPCHHSCQHHLLAGLRVGRSILRQGIAQGSPVVVDRPRRGGSHRLGGGGRLVDPKLRQTVQGAKSHAIEGAWLYLEHGAYGHGDNSSGSQQRWRRRQQ
ncbi:hypothetical protein E2562_021603 [Oryza meyeriana var. granulata]|uniref:Uncharacterized protein n=1 Tax=Oryza meyeriana var. granulata TaxID=110450 RepID=A0A6G1EA75_9ORYZ|nr:hypothetical protein E2562_021603 [Oryza meyeriana var. granulata]